MKISELIIETKLFPPLTQSRLVNRPQLVAKLERCTSSPLVLIKAPAGYGKTTAASHWYQGLMEQDKPVGWFSLDTLDNDVKRFMYYLVAAFQKAYPKFGRSVLGQLDSPGKLSNEALAATLIREIIQLGKSMYLVLDDFHFISDVNVIEVLHLLLEKLPPNLSLIILSRKSLPFETSRLKALGHMNEVSANDLRFNSTEITQLLNQEEKLQLSGEAIETLHEKTEGWVAGLKLASITLQGQLNAEEFISSFSGNNYDIANFLAEEVLRKQDEETTKFLLYTSILDRMCADLCNAITGENNGQAMLAKLEKLGLFLIPLDNDAKWYRYHHLFSEFMQNSLNSLDSALPVKLNQAASTWFAEHELIDEAIKYALLAGDMETAAKLLDSHSSKMFYDGRLHNLLHWADQIDESYLVHYPRILLNYAWVLTLRWRFLIAGRILNKVRQNLESLETNDSTDKNTLSELKLVLLHREMMLSQFSDDMKSVREQCKELLGKADIDDTYLTGNIYTSLIYADREFLNVHNFSQHDYKARELYKEANSLFVLIWHGSIVGPTEYIQGRAQEAKTVLTNSWKYACDISGESSPLAAMPALLLADVLYELHEFDRADDLISRYLPLSEQVGFVDQLIAGYTTRAKLLYDKGQTNEAKHLLQQGERIASSHDFPRLHVAVLTEKVRLAAIESDKSAIKNCISAMKKYQSTTDLKPCQEARTTDALIALSWCRFYRVDGELQESILLARQWAHFCLSRGIYREYIKFICVQIAAHQLQGENKVAMRLLDKALQNIEGCSLVKSFFEESALIERMLISMTSFPEGVRNTVVERARDIMQTAGGLPDAAEDTPAKIEQPVAPLDKQELSILKMVANGRLNREIASHLNMTEGTVKWYMQVIFSKLHVRRRSLAVQRARELGILK